jgi:hypothetical protein
MLCLEYTATHFADLPNTKALTMHLRRWLTPALLSTSLLTSSIALAQEPAQDDDSVGGVEGGIEGGTVTQPVEQPAPVEPTRVGQPEPVVEPAAPMAKAPEVVEESEPREKPATGALDSSKPGAEPVNASDALRSLRDDDRSFHSGRWSYRFGGYIRTTYTAIANDPQSPLFGRNDGFALANVRPYLLGAMDNGIGFSLQLEIAAGLDRGSAILPDQEVLVRPRDAYIFYAPSKLLELQLGAFRPPHDAESLLPTNNMLFTRRSVGADGVSPAEGYQTPGLGIDRQLGLQVTGSHFFTSPDGRREGPGFQYALAVTNGTPSARTLNDNDSLAYWGRVSFLWGDMLRVGAAYMYNDATLGDPPDQVGERQAGWTADLMFSSHGATVFGSYTSRTSTTDFGQNSSGGEDPFTTANAFQVQAGYLIPVVRLQPVYRFAKFDPTADYNIPSSGDFRESDAVTQHTFGLNYIAEDYPITVMLDYTVAQEQDARKLDNDRVEALVQLTW